MSAPSSDAIELGARKIYVLPTGHACTLERLPGSALGMALHALSLLTQSRLIADIVLHKHDATLIVMPPPCPLTIAPIDCAHARSSSRAPPAMPVHSSRTAAPSAHRYACASTATPQPS